MKRVLSLRNSIVITAILLGVFFSSSSFTFGLVQEVQLVENGPQKKEQRVKVIVNKDGKETKIDTTFNLSDEKMINFKVDSILKKLDLEGIGTGKSRVFIHRGGNRMKWNNPEDKNLPGEEHFDILIQHGDSGMKKHMRRIIHFDDHDSIISLNDCIGDELRPPLPPMPPYPPFVIHKRFGGDPFAIDLKDESIISYDKKDIGKGMEKITIIRKKQQ